MSRSSADRIKTGDIPNHASVGAKYACVLLLFYFRVSQAHPSLVASNDQKTPSLPMKIAIGF
jgi:hypothetical protein